MSLALPAEEERASTVAAVLEFCRANPSGAVSLLAILAMLAAGVTAPWLAPYDPIAVDYANMLLPPSAEHWAGTDAFGRDIFSRLLYGARTALIIGLTASFLGCTLGAAIGIASAYFGGTVDILVQRLTDILLSLPLVVVALVVVAILDRNLVLGIDLNLIIAIAVPIVPNVTRVLRAAALSVRELPYVDAARAAGYSHLRILARHLAPNLAAPYLIMLTSYVAQAILLEASLSFLGLGMPEPEPAWGLMMTGPAFSFFTQAPWLVIFPGLAISVAVFSFNLFGDTLRDWLDPKLKT